MEPTLKAPKPIYSPRADEIRHAEGRSLIRFSEALLKHGDREGRVYVTSEKRPDGFFQC